MSLRTLATRDWHVKTAVDVQMTSAVRVVSPAAVHNGPALSAVLAPLADKAGLTILREPAAGAVLVDGEPCRSLAAVVREPAERYLSPGEVAVPFAALDAAQVDFAALVAVTVPPLLRMLAAGVALEAHGQNTLLVLRDGHPARLLYRDLGGVRVSPLRSGDCPPLLGDLSS